jgi:hypothetical protein
MDVKRKIRGLFWVSDEPAASAPRTAERAPAQVRAVAAASAAAPSATTAPPAAAAASAAAAAPASAVAPAGERPEADFAAIYAKANTAGDPRVDQVLTAFEAMKAAMPPAQLAIAIGATASAIGADRNVIAETVARRLETIDAVVAAEQRGASQRRAARAQELQAQTAAAHAEIEAAEARIAALRQQLAAATTAAQQQDAREQGLASTFEHRAREEAARLTALRDFLR